jgi:hypothetical protein
MSQENVEIVRSFIDTLNRGELDAGLSVTSSDFELDFSRADGPGSATTRPRSRSAPTSIGSKARTSASRWTSRPSSMGQRLGQQARQN